MVVRKNSRKSSFRKNRKKSKKRSLRKNRKKSQKRGGEEKIVFGIGYLQ